MGKFLESVASVVYEEWKWPALDLEDSLMLGKPGLKYKIPLNMLVCAEWA